MDFHQTNLRCSPARVMVMFFLFAGMIHAQQNWPSFRGQNGRGIAEGYSTPVKWDVTQSENIRWKVSIPGLGHSSPAIWGDRVFVTTAVKDTDQELKVGLYGNVESVIDDDAYTWIVYCINAKTGKVLWEKQAHTGKPKVKRHPKSSHANATPCTDGKYVIAFFGSEGLYCYDMDGKLTWSKDLGVLDSGWFRNPTAQWGGGSSPIIHGQMVILQCDVQKNSFIGSFDLKTGKEIWRTKRDDVPTWSTPTIYETNEQTNIVVNGYKHIGGYDIAGGTEIWRMTGGGDIPVPTPVVGDGLIYITNAHGRMSPVYAIRTSANGDISLAKDESSNEHVAWSYSRGGNYMTTPVLYKGLLYCCSNSGKLSCFDAKTGKQLYRENIGGRSVAFSASPVAAEGKIYFPGEKGDIYVVQAGAEFKLLAVNSMGETCMASPAISQGILFLRTRSHLVAVEKE